MKIGDRIKERRIACGMSVTDLANVLGKNRSTVYRYESSEIENLPTDVLLPIATALHTSPAYLMGWSDSPDGSGAYKIVVTEKASSPKEAIFIAVKKMLLAEGDTEKAESLTPDEAVEFYKLSGFDDVTEVTEEEIPYSPTTRIPILGTISAGLPLYAEEHIEGYTYTDLNHGNEYFGLRVKGDSMTAARIHEGDIVIIRRQDYIENGEIAVVIVGDDEATIKRYYQDENSPIVTLTPQSYNPEHQPQTYDARKTNIRILGKVVRVQIDF